MSADTQQGVSAAELLRDLRHVTMKLKGAPSEHDYETHGRYARSALDRQFGSWEDALLEAGLVLEYDADEYEIPELELLADLERVAGKLGRPPKPFEYTVYGHYHEAVVRECIEDRFEFLAREAYDMATRDGGEGPGTDAVSGPEERRVDGEVVRFVTCDHCGERVLGERLCPHCRELTSPDVVVLDDNGLIPEQELLADIKAVGEIFGRPPSIREYRWNCTYSDSTVKSRFGTWNTAVSKAGYEPNRPDGKIPTEDLITDLTHVAEEVGSPPSQTKYKRWGAYSRSTLSDRFAGGWDTIAAAAYESPTELAGLADRNTEDANE